MNKIEGGFYPGTYNHTVFKTQYRWELKRNFNPLRISTDSGIRIWPFKTMYVGVPILSEQLIKYLHNSPEYVILTPSEYLMKKLKGDI